ncbi:TPA: flagellar protein export ATPase FliI [Candidatus Galligastranaerophilus intestinavium]|uniref:Flagellar protein export ATPase FliI n=1 Tax=Candidatus Galligastranaerophilus intestinavium TaxID=2840836 RepID=A0A9D1FJ17_9BACT|nr:flagellar protein export ATPase FliI [Candidatus Galligastranaerophilus intestinavium]
MTREKLLDKFDFSPYKKILNDINPVVKVGKVVEIIGLIIEADGPESSIGDLCHIVSDDIEPISCEVVGFRENRILLMPLGSIEGLKAGAKVVNSGSDMKVKVSDSLLGRVLDGLGNPIDGLGEIAADKYYSTSGKLINPLKRKPIDEPLSLGIRAIDGLITVGKGQRMGIFAGSGVGKSTTLAMMAKNTSADINVIALIGERGREVREFIEHTLGVDGMKRSVVVVATSEQPSLVKIKAAFVACAIAEYFRDKGKDVLFMLDSVTRIALAQREVGLAVGEPPATRGYTPSVFALMPKFLERAGCNEYGTITGLYTVLVEGDDFNEPVSDTARSILDGHIMLSRSLAHKNHYPAIDVLQSISRVMNNIVDKEHKDAAGKIRSLLASYAKNEDLINIGAYQRGADPLVDKAISLMDKIDRYLIQSGEDKTDYQTSVSEIIRLAQM